jgi:acid phosphatase (class A)
LPGQSLLLNAFALVPAGNDVTTKPDLYYLTNAQAIDSLTLLPPPPEVGSIAFLNDQAMYEKGRLLRGTERGKLAVEDANLSGGGVANAFSGFAHYRQRCAGAAQAAHQHD